jgi:prepilin-type N-terminal cleavage/methylation domain-containing protein
MDKNKSYANKQAGFTLIELLVVIAIIGVLASVVLASLSSARNKGADAAIKAQLASARTQAELFYSIGNTYDSVCSTVGSSGGIQTLVQAAMKNYNNTITVGGDAAASTTTTSVCHDSAGAWAAIVPLKSPNLANASFCVDSTGFAKETTTQLAASIYQCS